MLNMLKMVIGYIPKYNSPEILMEYTRFVVDILNRNTKYVYGTLLVALIFAFFGNRFKTIAFTTIFSTIAFFYIANLRSFVEGLIIRDDAQNTMGYTILSFIHEMLVHATENNVFLFIIVLILGLITYKIANLVVFLFGMAIFSQIAWQIIQKSVEYESTGKYVYLGILLVSLLIIYILCKNSISILSAYVISSWASYFIVIAGAKLFSKDVNIIGHMERIIKSEFSDLLSIDFVVVWLSIFLLSSTYQIAFSKRKNQSSYFV